MKALPDKKTPEGWFKGPIQGLNLVQQCKLLDIIARFFILQAQK